MRPLVVSVMLAVVLVASLDAKGPTTRIVITDVARGGVSEITDRALLDRFHVWAGRGTYSGAPDRQTEGTEGFIVEWTAGTVDQRPSQLRKYELRFYVAPRRAVPSAITASASADELAYIVFYEHDSATGRGYVYLPGRSDEHFGLNVRSIHRGLEGQWLHANRAWESVFAALPAAR